MESIFGYEYEPVAHLLVTDEDAADFLQSQFSNELRPVEAGRCRYGLWLDVKGKVVADSVVLCEGEERFRVFSEHSTAAVIAEKLEHHIIADDVVIELLPTGRAIALVGAGVVEVLQALAIEVPELGRYVQVAGVTAFRGRRSRELSVELWAESIETLDAVKLQLSELGVEWASAEQFGMMRIAAGIPSVPSEIGPDDLPGEGGLVGDGVSLTKGCYLGQEVVARMHNVGRPQRGLFRVSGSGAAPICPIALYNMESKKVGDLRSAYIGNAGWVGVALLKTRFAAIGDSLTGECGVVEVASVFTDLKKGVS